MLLALPSPPTMAAQGENSLGAKGAEENFDLRTGAKKNGKAFWGGSGRGRPPPATH